MYQYTYLDTLPDISILFGIREMFFDNFSRNSDARAIVLSHPISPQAVAGQAIRAHHSDGWLA
ncbi:hypothetical protein QUA41_06285 [Microcoleus sp. Pol11C1]|uniref:hypothetical protein n=1 Tax=unclassified Microcoleus TaxID=2642155 RepID=UPI002FD08A54